MATPEMLQPAVQLIELEHSNHHLHRINKLGIKQDVSSIFGKKYKPKIIISTPTLAGSGTEEASAAPDPRPYACMFCPAAFKTEAALVNHVRVHVGAGAPGVNGAPPAVGKQIVHSCLYCNRSFKQATNLEIHVRTYHPYGDGSNGQQMNYNQAGLNAAYMMNQAGLALWEYKNQEHQQQQQQEENSGEETSEGNNNQTSQNSHSNVVQVKVEKGENGMTVAQQWDKISPKDIEAYQLERPYRCAYCIKSFKQAAHLKQHMRIHNDERPYECTYCARRFRQKAVLDQHVRLHTGEKPYVCVQCGNSFRQLTNLKSHLNTCTGQPPSYLACHSIWGKNIENAAPGKPRRGRKSTPQNQYIRLTEGMCSNEKVTEWLKSEAASQRLSQDPTTQDQEGKGPHPPPNPSTSSRSLWSKAMSLDTASKSLQHHWNNSGGGKDLGHTISGVALWEHNRAMQQQHQTQEQQHETQEQQQTSENS